MFSNEHTPIHVHGKYQDCECKAEIVANGQKIESVDFFDIPGKRPLPPAKLRDFKALITHEAENIVASWNEYFLHHRHVESKIITRKIR